MAKQTIKTPVTKCIIAVTFEDDDYPHKAQIEKEFRLKIGGDLRFSQVVTNEQLSAETYNMIRDGLAEYETKIYGEHVETDEEA